MIPPGLEKTIVPPGTEVPATKSVIRPNTVPLNWTGVVLMTRLSTAKLVLFKPFEKVAVLPVGRKAPGNRSQLMIAEGLSMNTVSTPGVARS